MDIKVAERDARYTRVETVGAIMTGEAKVIELVDKASEALLSVRVKTSPLGAIEVVIYGPKADLDTKAAVFNRPFAEGKVVEFPPLTGKLNRYRDENGVWRDKLTLDDGNEPPSEPAPPAEKVTVTV